MKVLQFTIPVANDQTVIVQEDIMPHFYPYLHRHKEAQLIWIKEGEGTLLVDNRMHPFKRNDIFFLTANQPHLFKSNPEYFKTNSGLQIQALMLFFDPVGKLQPFLALPEMQLISSFLQLAKGGLKIQPAQTDQIIQLMLTIQYAKNHQVMIQFLQLLETLSQIQNISAPLVAAGPPPFSESEGIRMGHIFNFLMQHYDRNLTLEEVAASAHLTPPAFCRYFKKHTRQTFVAFLNEIRINEACKKLTGSGYTQNISTVAYSCGFNSLTHFNRVFKSLRQQSPKAYLNQYFKRLK
ncbi:MAG: AraC family transcriptional regulator [Bacteroidota bacterium]